MEVETLIPQMQDTLSKIQIAVNELSAKAQYDELDQLERKRERLLADLKTSFEKEVRELEAKHQKELEDIKTKRKQEDEERAARRRREDEELQKAKSNEDTVRQKKHATEVDSIEDETERKMDEVEEVAQRVTQQGKRKLQELEEKRRELNRRIDEQLKQSLPATPPRKRDKPKKETENPQRDGVNGDSASAGSQNNDSSPKKKPETPPKPRESSVVASQEKSPEAKKDGEVPFQERAIGPPLTAKKPIESFPRSFAEVLKNNMSNGSKDKPEVGKISSKQATQEGHGEDDRGKPSIKQVASSGSTEASKMKHIERDDQNPEHTNPSSDNKPKLERSEYQDDEKISFQSLPAPQLVRPDSGLTNSSAGSQRVIKLKAKNQINLEKHFQTLQSVSTESQNAVFSKTDENERGTEPQREKDQLFNPKINEKEPEQSSPIAANEENPEEPRCVPEEDHLAANTLVTEMRTVVQSSRLPSSSNQRSPRQGSETRDQVELEQPAVPDSLEQNKPDDSRAAVGAPRRSQNPGRLAQTPDEPVFLVPPSPIRGDLVLSLDGDVFDLSPDRETPIGFEHIQDPNSAYLHVIGQRGRENCASPLPVENETVRGQDLLFDDNKSPSEISEPDTSEDESNLLPNIPIQSQGLPVLLEPPSKARLDDQGLTTLIGEFDNWAILTEQITERANADVSRPFSLNFPPVQQYEDFRRLDIQTKPESGYFDDDSHDKSRPKVNMKWRPTNQTSSAVRAGSPIHYTPCEPGRSPSLPNHLPQDKDRIDGQGPRHSQSSPIKRLCSDVLSGLVGPSPRKPDSSPHNVTSAERETHKLRSNSIKSRPKRPKQRGRPKIKSFRSHERALNPREQLFDSIDKDITTRSGWFKRSKRRLSQGV
ncbi:hypothetical protein ANO14919_145990 [Xylariales sp. No.14919]|nr:hypothetical protein ANO14919_090030 [Xylariales sp. No.14919]GAW25001.1 hypothetical protein ANO14919_145990 [Xylariales sp. No.14919]